MPQSRVSFEPEQVYHIWTHANGRENLFGIGENYRYFLKKYAFYIHPVVDTYAYCLMPNHLHLMVRIKSEEEVLAALGKRRPTLQGFETLGGFSKAISLQFSHLFNAYTQAYNKAYKRKRKEALEWFGSLEIFQKEHLSSLSKDMLKELE